MDDHPVTEETSDTERMTFIGHLGELRTRLVRSTIAVFVSIIVCYIFSNSLITFLAEPLMSLQINETEIEAGADTVPAESNAEADEEESRWTALTPLEPILVKLKISAYAGLLFALPYLIFQVCGFVFPGLTAKERRAAKILLAGCSVLAISGVLIAYWGVLPIVLQYVVAFAPDFVRIQFRLNETLSLIMKALFGFAIAFQFPMIVLVLVYMGLLTPATLKAYRKVAVVGMFVFGALLTPPDPLSMLMLAVPLVLLYELSILLSYLVVRRKQADDSDTS